MSSSVAHLLLASTLASSLGVLVVGALRGPFRYLVGARAAYWVWLLVPASALAVCVPGPSHSVRTMAAGLPSHTAAVLASVMSSVGAAVNSPNYLVVGALSLWVVGAIVMLALLVRRQVVFVRRLGDLTSEADGIYQSSSLAAPLLIGIWRPKIVVPADFTTRYNPEERALVLAHERAHAARRDLVITSLASVWVCIAWFNPLMYWALGRLRFDQDLACDVVVLARSRASRSAYAKALLKAQLSGQSAMRLPLGCHWQSTHPLKERITMLKHPSAGIARRTIGVAIAISVAIGGGYTAWAAQSDTPPASAVGKIIAVHMKWWVNGKNVLQVVGPIATQDIRVVSGNEFVEKVSFAPGQSFETRCFASLSNEDRPSPVWDTAKAFRKEGVAGLILLECKLSNDDKVFSTPALLVGEGKVGTIEVVNPEDTVHFKLEFNASAKPARIAESK